MKAASFWRLASALTGVMAFAVFPAFAIGTLAPFLRGDLGITEGQVGLLFALFFAVAGLASPLAGHLADRWGPDRVVQAMLVLVAAVAAAMSLAPNTVILAFLFGLAGLAYAGANPATNAFIQAHLQRARGLALGTKQAGVPAGALLAGFLLPSIAGRAGWRAAMVVPLVGALMALIWFTWTLRIEVNGRGRAGRATESADRGVVAEHLPMAGLGAFGALALYAFCLAAAEASLESYLVLYLHEAVGYPVAVAGAALGLAGLAGIGGRIAWAWLTDTVFQRRPWLALTIVAVGGGAAVGSALLQSLGARPLLWLMALLFGVFLFGAGGALGVSILQLAGHRAGLGTGVTYTGFYAGLTLGPITFGWLVSTAGYRPVWLLAVGLMALAASIAATAVRRAGSIDLAAARRSPADGREI